MIGIMGLGPWWTPWGWETVMGTVGLGDYGEHHGTEPGPGC